MPFCPLNYSCRYPNSDIERHLKLVHNVQSNLLEPLSRYVTTEDFTENERIKLFNHMVTVNYRTIVLLFTKPSEKRTLSGASPTQFRDLAKQSLITRRPFSFYLSCQSYATVWLRKFRANPTGKQIKPTPDEVTKELKAQRAKHSA
ncbi:hypothetical protein BCR33DRAFT_569385 [Rhizoclosmatium globosum]|uniref:Uncharacterized protein n=1 Tax=Rhizoclosmatium globosum TaxID=329046 RepID=A0A1Y2B5L2_9FUNG|nr:hypothetical protein BCR33DRAFT_569385 [Rhizoclosmatium globosum]|eukprot:ORY30103.1 hypothetical protein BCR33DRAFT_569385 [Rhizoclosmatium globosum]